jgi:hypothetical protein
LTNWNFRGVFFTYNKFSRKDQRSCDGMGHYIFSLAGPVGDYTRAHAVIFRLQGCGGWGEEYYIYIKASEVQWKDIRTRQLDVFLKISRGFLCILRRKDQRSCDGRAA